MARETQHDYAALLLRLGYAALLIGFHGWTRFFAAFHYAVGHRPWPFVNVVRGLGFPMPGAFAVLSAMAESIGSLFVGLGLFTRWAAFVIICSMSVAVYTKVREGFNSGVELPGLYLLGALSILILGGGRFSLGAFLRGRR